MAFYYYTTEAIKEIDPEAIPESFTEYFNDLADEMKSEIRDYRPDLYARMMEPENTAALDFDLFDDSDLSVDEQRIMDKWESINIQEWHKDTIYTDVLVSKVIPDGTRRCKIHKRDFIKKQIKYQDGYAVFGHYGFLCPDCMALYIEESKIGNIIEKLDKRNHEMLIQRMEDTLQEWDEYVEPTEISDDTKIYIPDNWADVDMRCPEDGGKLISDVYKKVYRDREVRFDACQCTKCNKILMRHSLAQQLSLDFGRVGVPGVDFEKTKPFVKTARRRATNFRPNYFVQNGEKSVYDYDDKEWEELSESSIFVVSYSRVCSIEDHDSNEELVLVRVDEKKGGRKEYLLLVGYCEDCNKYYIAQEDYEIIYSVGRPNVTIYDDTNSNYYIQSGSVFDGERNYLEKVESNIRDRILEIESNENYVSQYAVYSGGYDEGGLAAQKESSKPMQAEISNLAAHIDNPYGYRVELLDDNTPKVYYLGADDFEIGSERFFSFNSSWGREMVNYRNIEINLNGKKLQVKRRRQFDISKAVLYGYTEQSDEDAIFREGLTDRYLVEVLNTRKKQRQLVDIMFTIQENQNVIIDAPLRENIIVQGCAGSGKTVVMLHRLSALKYGNPDFDFGNVVILTPNDNFNTHISGLASSLQLGYIERLSVEKYYEYLLLRYSPDFKLKYAIADEVNVNQVFVDYVYSEEFLKHFWNAYDNKMDELKLLFDKAILYSKRLLDERTINACINDGENKTFILLKVVKELNDRIERILSRRDVERNNAYEIIIPEETEDREIIVSFLEKIERYTIKTIYNEIYEAAAKEADDILYLRTGKRYLGGTKGTHRYDLYLQLLFAQRLYGYNAGSNTLICIDEGQDLCVNEYKLIQSINAGKPIFNVFGDTNQLLKYNRGICDWESVGKYIDNPRLFVLNENFRNTNQITQFCNDNFKMNVAQTGVDGHKVKEIIRSKFEAALSELVVMEERVAVLLPRAVKKKDYIDLEQLPVSVQDILGDQIGNGRICVSYVDEVKGIEFDKVFVVTNGLTNNEKYIAYTRALSELTIVYDEELEEKIREKEEEKLRAKEKAIKTANESLEDTKKTKATTSKNVKFGKVKSNKAKVTEYENYKIAHSYICRRCKKKIEITQKEVDKFMSIGLELPKTCPDCKKLLKEVIDIGKCKYCGNKIQMKRSKYEHLKKDGKLVLCCSDCVLKMQEKKQQDNQIYQVRKCMDCLKSFEITYGEKDFFEKKEWTLPNRCPNCRKRRRGQ